jgi:hypothetical protein
VIRGIFIQGVNKLLGRLRRWGVKHGVVEDVIVGYAQPYAIYVHEAPMVLKGLPRRKPSTGRYWDPPGARSKFLEEPVRQMARELGRAVARSVITGSNFEDALYQAGLKLQAASQKLVPIDFGPLIASAYVAKESKEPSVAAEALARSSMLRPPRKRRK